MSMSICLRRREEEGGGGALCFWRGSHSRPCGMKADENDDAIWLYYVKEEGRRRYMEGIGIL